MVDAPTILLADDDQDFTLLFRIAFEFAGSAIAIHNVHTGPEVIAYLRTQSEDWEQRVHPFPDLTLLDTWLPGQNGFEVLNWIRVRPRFAAMRVLMMAGTRQAGEATLAKANGAEDLLVKPLKFSNLTRLAERLSRTWLRVPESQLG